MEYVVFGVGDEVRRKYKDEFLEKISYFIDNDDSKIGKTFYGKKIYSPSRLKDSDIENVYIFISSILNYTQIKKQLIKMGYENHFIWAPDWYGNNIISSPYGHESWKMKEKDFNFSALEKRVRNMAELIGADCNSIMDLGCDKMSLYNFISHKIKYIPVDYIESSDKVLVCDFNKYEFPNIKTDYIFVSGLIEYIVDIKWFIAMLSEHCNYIILSYNPIEKVMDMSYRHNAGWVNNLSTVQLLNELYKNGFVLIEDKIYDGNDIIIKCMKG